MITIGIKTTKQNKSLFLVYYIIFILHVNKARSIKGKKSFSVLGIFVWLFPNPASRIFGWRTKHVIGRCSFDGKQQHPILLDPRMLFGVRRAILRLDPSK